MLPRRPMSPNTIKSDLHQPKAKNQPQGQLAALLHGKLDYDDLFASQGGSLFPDDHRSTSAPPSQLLARRANQSEETEEKYLPDNMGESRQPWQLWETDHEHPGQDMRSGFSLDKEEMANRRQRNLVDLIQQDFPRTPSPLFALQQQARQRHAAAAAAAAAAANSGFSFDDVSNDPMQQYNMENALLNRSRQPSNSQLPVDEVSLSSSNFNLDESVRNHGNTISPTLRNMTGTPPRSNSTPPGRNMYNEVDRQTKLMMNQFGLNEE
ncbi:hypothetical protein K501DRAFT_281082, partial [Backusella circina FSU 941]